jgi:hypothetical protein
MSQPAGPTRVKLERESYIPVPKQHVVRALAERLDDPQDHRRFQDFCRLVEGIYHFEYHQTASELKQDYRLFDNNGGIYERCLLGEEQLLEAEERFLRNFRRLMEKGNFRPLTQQDVEVAKAEDYLFNLPVQTDWSKLDQRMLRGFYARHGYGVEGQPPDFAERIMIFRRGVGIDQTVGFLILAKIDLAVSNLLIGAWRVCRGVVGVVSSLVGRRADRFPKAKAEAVKEAVKTASDGAASASATSDAALGSDETFMPVTTPAADTAGRSARRFADRYVERITLRNHGVGPLSLFQRTAIQEPTFGELVILFRFATPATVKDATDNDWSIHIKTFRDIPMADLEVVFPEKHISMKPLDLAKLLITGAIGLGVASAKLLVSAINPILAAAALTTVAGYASRIFFGFKASKDRYNHLVTNSLYHKSLDNDLGVIFYLMDSLEEQEFKETLLGYYVLWREGDKTQAELDDRCEELLYEQFGLEADFEVADALAKLERDDLIVRSGEQFHARPLEEALQRLDAKWDGFFRYHQG